MTNPMLAINFDIINLQTLTAVALVIAPVILFFGLSHFRKEMKKRKRYKSQRSVIRYWKSISKQNEFRLH